MGSLNSFDSLAEYNAATIDKPAVSYIKSLDSIVYDEESFSEKYTSLVSIRFDSDQFAMLKIQDNASLGFEIKAQPLVATTGYRGLLGSYYNFIRFYKSQIQSDRGGQNVFNQDFTEVIGKDFVIQRLSDKSISINDVPYPLATGGETFGGNICLGAYNDTQPAIKRFIGKVYYAKVYKNEELIADLVPAKRNADNVIGFFDNISKAFYTSLGNYPFVDGES